MGLFDCGTDRLVETSRRFWPFILGFTLNLFGVCVWLLAHLGCLVTQETY
jgi:hypothetical protein